MCATCVKGTWFSSYLSFLSFTCSGWALWDSLICPETQFTCLRLSSHFCIKARSRGRYHLVCAKVNSWAACGRCLKRSWHWSHPPPPCHSLSIWTPLYLPVSPLMMVWTRRGHNKYSVAMVAFLWGPRKQNIASEKKCCLMLYDSYCQWP